MYIILPIIQIFIATTYTTNTILTENRSMLTPPFGSSFKTIHHKNHNKPDKNYNAVINMTETLIKKVIRFEKPCLQHLEQLCFK